MRAALTEVRRQAATAAREQARSNLEAGRSFLARNRGREGVIALASGLQYEILEAGSGPHPDPTSRVTVHYRGTLLDGTEFDSSYGRGEPAIFGLDHVIAGWREALPLMPEGAKWKLFVPPDLAYGERGAGPRIPPNATLVFEVELVSANAE
jgi:FKBP-type peptidyl-prolyl cis-trans isomerase